MDNSTRKLLNLTDPTAEIVSIDETEDTVTVTIKSNVPIMYCPLCNTRMRSKGIITREISHPVLQTGKNLVLLYKQRKWKCPNGDCNHYCRDSLNFLEPYKRSTNFVPYAILNEMKDIHLSAKQIGKRFDKSDTYVHQTFMRFVDLPRLELPEIISIDEVYMKFNNEDKYALVIIDFKTGEIIDILPNRLEKDTSPYFLNIPLEERNKVKYLVCDMYKPYLNYTHRFFRQSIAIVDSFHVIQLINKEINIILNAKRRELNALQRKKLDEYNELHHTNLQSLPESDELYVLRKFKWVILKNKDNIKYSHDGRYNRKFKQCLNTYQIEAKFFDLDPTYREIRELKEKYIKFNNDHVNDLDGAREDLKSIISTYESSDIYMFNTKIANTLKNHFEEIINSFTYITGAQRKTVENQYTRISNGLMECNNNVFKDLKRQSKGVTNFDYTRNRILWATRKDPAFLAVPKSLKEVRTIGKPRGPYKK